MNAKPGAVITLSSFADHEITSVTMPSVGRLEFKKTFGLLAVKLPEKLPTRYVNMLRLEGDKL